MTDKPSNSDSKSGGNRKHRNKYKKKNPNNDSNNSSRNRRPKSLTPLRVIQKYDNLLDQYTIARKKFYEVYARISGKQLQKVVSNYNRTLSALNGYKDTLNDWQKEVLLKKIDLYPEDTQFSSEHNLGLEGEIIPAVEGKFEDPHLLETQAESSYKEDKEETSGTIEDYKNYKDQH